MKILITGGAGFIGSHLVQNLLDSGHKVICLDNLSTGSLKNIQRYSSNKSFSFCLGSVTDYKTVEQLVNKSDVVYHLAAAVGVKLILEKSLDSIETNIQGTINVLKAAEKKKTPTFIASTSEVYGKSKQIPFSEKDDLVIGPTYLSRWSYACSKALDEFLALSFSKERNLPVVVVRFFNTVGPGQTAQYGMVVPRFIRQALNNEAITIFGDGTQSRCFTHIDDVVHALHKLLNNEKAFGNVINIGSTQEVSIKELASLIIKRTKSSSKLTYIHPSKVYNGEFEDMSRRVPDVSKLKNIIEFTPQLTIDNILEDTIKYIINENKNELGEDLLPLCTPSDIIMAA